MERSTTYKLFLWFFLLSFSAGYLNGATMLLYAVPSSHFTGNLTNLILDFFYQGEFWYFFIIYLLCFFLGSAAAGIIFPVNAFYPDIRYSIILFGTGSVFFACSLLPIYPPILMSLITFSLGLQNGMTIFYKGLQVRTTHVTGNITASGYMFGRYLRYKDSSWKSGLFFFYHVASFGVGSTVAAFLFFKTHWNLLLIVSLVIFTAAGLYLHIRPLLITEVRTSEHEYSWSKDQK